MGYGSRKERYGHKGSSANEFREGGEGIREVVQWVVQEVMEAELTAYTGVENYERTEELGYLIIL